jgi:hypothetical protein
MARLWSNGFEGQLLSTTANTQVEGIEGLISGTPVIDLTVPRSGLACLECTTGTAKYWQAGPTTLSLDRDYWTRAALRRVGSITALIRVVHVVSTAGETIGSIRWETNGKLQLYDSKGEKVGPAVETTTGKWYVVEMNFRVNTAGKGKLGWKLDGVVIQEPIAAETLNAAANRLRYGCDASPGTTVYVDDLCLNDDQGANQNSWPGLGKLVLLKPTSDKANTGFTAGGGGTEKLFEALDNRPPTGKASPGENGTQIGSANNNATDNAEFNLAAYSKPVAEGGGGIAATDNIILLAYMARYGTSSTTARSLGISGASNPSATETVVNTISAAAVSTEPTAWFTRYTAVAYLPSVTIGTSPVVKVRKAAATTDRINVDMVGMYVEYRPGLSLELTDAAVFSETHGSGDTKPLADSQALSDSSNLAMGKGFAESIAVTETRSLAAGRVLADVLAVTETRSLAAGKPLSDSQAFTDALVRGLGLKPADAITLTEALTKTTLLTRSETVALEDTIARAWASRLAPVDTFSTSDVRTAAISKALTEAFAATETRSQAIGINRAEGISLLDEMRRSLARVLTESFGWSDALSRDLGISLADGFGLLDQIAVEGLSGISLADLIVLSDSRAAVVNKPLHDALAPTETHALGIGLSRTEQAAFADALTRRLGLSRAEAIALTDEVDIKVMLGRAFTDATVFTDSLVRAVAVRPSDQLLLSDEVGRAWTVKLAITDAISLGESMEVIDVAGRRVGESTLGELSPQGAILTEHQPGARLGEDPTGGATLG